MNNLLQNRPVFQTGAKAARENDWIVARVVSPKRIQQASTNTGMRQPRSADLVVTLERVVTPTMELGTTSRTPPGIIPNNHLNFSLDPLAKPTPSGGLDSLASASLSPIRVCHNPTHNPLPQIAQPTNIAPQYFVTELDNPKSLTINPILKPLNQSPIPPLIVEVCPPNNPSEITHPPSPTKKPIPTQVDISLAIVFNSLTIKRKAQDEFEERGRSKILCLCAPEKSTNPPTFPTLNAKPKPKPIRPSRASPRRTISSKPKGKASSEGIYALELEENLCEVSIR